MLKVYRIVTVHRRETYGWGFFTDSVKEVDRKLTAQGRKMAMIIDDCHAHSTIDNLKAVTTKVNQFYYHQTQRYICSQWTMTSLEAFYPHSHIKYYITSINQGKSPRKLNIYDSAYCSLGHLAM